MPSMSIIIKPILTLVVVLSLVSCLFSSPLEAKLLRRQRIYDDSYGGYGSSPYDYSGGATGERAIMTIRGARSGPYGMPPSRIQIEDSPYRGSYPRGVYDRLDGYGGGRGRMPGYPQSDYGYSNYGGIRRRDFLDPDFGFRGSLRLTSKRNKCRVKSEADSEIPELGLDTGHLDVNCAVNPAEVVGSVARAAHKYGQYRREKKRNRPSASKRKRTRIRIDTDYERSKGDHDKQANDDDNDDDDD